MRDTKDSYLYIGDRAYQKTTLLIDVEVLELLRKHSERTPSEVVNEILIKALQCE